MISSLADRLWQRHNYGSMEIDTAWAELLHAIVSSFSARLETRKPGWVGHTTDLAAMIHL